MLIVYLLDFIQIKSIVTIVRYIQPVIEHIEILNTVQLKQKMMKQLKLMA